MWGQGQRRWNELHKRRRWQICGVAQESKAISHAQTSLTPCTDYTDRMKKPEAVPRLGENDRAGEGSVTVWDREQGCGRPQIQPQHQARWCEMRLWHGHSRFWLTLNVPLTLSPHSVPGLTQLQGAQRWQGIKESYINQCSGEWLTDTPHMIEHTISAIQRATRMIQRPQNLTLGKQSHTEAEKTSRARTDDEVCNFSFF